MLKGLLSVFLTVLINTLSGMVLAGGRHFIQKDDHSVPDYLPFERYFAWDKLLNKITFYLSKQPKGKNNLPLVIFIQGSGCDSLFSKGKDGMIYGGLQYFLLETVKNKARVMIIEKPGVNYLNESKNPGTAEGCSAEFLNKYTLENWSNTISTVLDEAIWGLKDLGMGIDPRKILLLGHSEGGCVAARVAVINPKVNYVASLACSGPTQLFDLITLARKQKDIKQADKEVKNIIDSWVDIQRNQNSIDKFFYGHPYKRWFSFFKASTIDDLLKTKAKIFIAAGTEDQSVPIESFDVLYASLLAKNKPVTAQRLLGVGHDFNKKNEIPGSPDGISRIFNSVIWWFLKN